MDIGDPEAPTDTILNVPPCVPQSHCNNYSVAVVYITQAIG